MDKAKFQEDAFRRVVSSVLKMMRRRAGLHPDLFDESCFVPVACADTCSVYYQHYDDMKPPVNENVINASEHMKWYKGPPLLSMLAALPDAPPSPATSALSLQPLTIVNIRAMKIGGIGTVCEGIVASGTIRLPQSCNVTLIEPSTSAQTNIGSMQMGHEPADVATAGTKMSVNMKKLIARDVPCGTVFLTYRAPGVLPAPRKPIPIVGYPVVAVDVRLVVMTHFRFPKHQVADRPITGFRMGNRYNMFAHGACVPVTVSTIHALLDHKTLRVSNSNVKQLQHADVAHVSLLIEKPIYLQSYRRCPALGRFSLHDNGEVIAVGVVVNVFEQSGQSLVTEENDVSGWCPETHYRYTLRFQQIVRTCLMMAQLRPDGRAWRPRSPWSWLNLDVMMLIFEKLAVHFPLQAPKPLTREQRAALYSDS
eukprot:TRINITY_DN7329_c0_g1_i1.p1 TRINITY_DN7329_c0_g1~~TRINITY_DN7329_c0_g1_i1.p1  ORF type:complete len:423 (-),score=82.35 TRINITY_DN7329_c0_g1_i1:63-1331(-)